MVKISATTRDKKISDRARQLFREQYGEELPVPERLLREAEHLLISEGAIQPKAVSFEKLTSQNDT
jgi:hypothetical protein